MPDYDSNLFDPPAPVAYATLRDPQTGVNVTDVPMLLDTGADATLIPRAAMEGLGLDPQSARHYELQGFDNRTSYVPAVRAEMFFLGRTYRGQFLVIDGQMGVIGRNILNTIRLQFDGPQLRWEAP